MEILERFYLCNPEEKQRENGFVLVLKYDDILSTHLTGFVPFGDVSKCEYWVGWLEYLGGIDTFDPDKKYRDYSTGRVFSRTIKPEIVAISIEIYERLEKEKQMKKRGISIIDPPSCCCFFVFAPSSFFYYKETEKEKEGQ